MIKRGSNRSAFHSGSLAASAFRGVRALGDKYTLVVQGTEVRKRQTWGISSLSEYPLRLVGSRLSYVNTAARAACGTHR